MISQTLNDEYSNIIMAMGTIIQTENDVDRFMNNTNQIFFIYDTGHFCRNKLLKNYISKINHIERYNKIF